MPSASSAERCASVASSRAAGAQAMCCWSCPSLSHAVCHSVQCASAVESEGEEGRAGEGVRLPSFVTKGALLVRRAAGEDGSNRARYAVCVTVDVQGLPVRLCVSLCVCLCECPWKGVFVSVCARASAATVGGVVTASHVGTDVATTATTAGPFLLLSPLPRRLVVWR